ncbi:hypothetical protein [Chelativorans xinjiangense]|uniref:hypothetical protein n=1 Tax=Chelativorans xinjiangense TaxID=2681485 RepID=UPI00135C81A7|nr:hypothetical protein [Chelativorans xinjiangense]
MNGTISEAEPIACTLEAGEFGKRLDWIAELNRAALLDVQRKGLRLILTYRGEHADRVREMVRQEQQCCGFLGFDLREGEGRVTLVIRAPESAADALDTIFEPFLQDSSRSGGCACAAASSRKGEDNDRC